MVGQPTNANILVRSPLSELTLQDAMGNKITEVLRGPFLKSFTWSDHIDSAFVAYGRFNNVYLIPFSSSFQDTVVRGCDFGSFAMSTQEKLMIVTAEPLGDQIVNVVSYSHGHIVCAGGKHYVQMKSSSGK
jgi:hypothetical protein